MKNSEQTWIIGKLKALNLVVMMLLAMTVPALAAQEYRPPQPENPSLQETKANPDEMSLEALSASPAAKAFQAGKYADALAEFQKLSQEYPKDPLIKRYIGMCTTLLGRLDEAAKTLEEAVKMEPEDPANHYFLARVYHEQGAQDKATKELAEVFRLDPDGYYGHAAKTAKPLVEEKALARKLWDLWIYGGFERDTNVPLEPNDKELRGTPHPDAGRYYYSVGGTYDWLERGNFTSIAGYRTYQSFQDNKLNGFDYDFHEFSLDNRFRGKFFGKDALYKLRYELPVGFLHANLFTFANAGLASMTVPFFPGTDTEIFDKYSHIEFGPDGFQPPFTSRDGEYNTAGFIHRIYFAGRRGNVYGGYEYQIAATRGLNFDSYENFMQLGFHTPLDFINKKLTWDVNASMAYENFPHYSPIFDPRNSPDRADKNFTLYTRLTYQVDRHWAIRLEYTYTNVDDPNDVYAYHRHIGGANILYRF